MSDQADPIGRFVVPLYMDLMGGSFWRFSKRPEGSNDRIEFEQKIRSAFRTVTPSDIEFILDDEGWRPQVVGSWLCAGKGWSQFAGAIAARLMKDKSGYGGLAHCLALYSFHDEASANHLCNYLDHWLPKRDQRFNQDDAMQALMFLDEKLGTEFAKKYQSPGGLWETWLSTSSEHGKTGLYSSIPALHYLRTLVE